MIRKIIQINEDKCNGCGLCADACHESAIGIINGKAKLLRDDYCDGLGDCLPACPTGAITFIRREAAAYDEAAVLANKHKLRQWPIQIKLVPISAPYFENAELLVAADCTAYAYYNFHNKFAERKITLIGCPKLDGMNYAEKLTEILCHNNIKSLTVIRMEVPCCGGIETAVSAAIQNSKKNIPLKVIIVSIDGQIIS